LSKSTRPSRHSCLRAAAAGTGRRTIADIIRDIRALTVSISVEVDDILANGSRAAIIEALQTRIKATGNITVTQFATILTITGDVVTRLQLPRTLTCPRRSVPNQ